MIDIRLASSWADGNLILNGKHCPVAVVRISKELIPVLPPV